MTYNIPLFIVGQHIYDYWLVLSSLISPLQFFGLISWFPKAKVSLVYVNYVTMVSSSSQCIPICSGNHPPYTPNSEKNISLPSPLQQSLNCSGNHPPYTPDSEKNIQLPSSLQWLLDWYIAVHRHEYQQSPIHETFHVQFGLKSIHHVKTLSLQFICWAAKVSILIMVKPKGV